MTPLERLLRQKAREASLPLDTIAKDFVIGHILAGISAAPPLNGKLVFKGGTALRKLHFGDYRFSEDLDFTARAAPQGEALRKALLGAAEIAARTLSVSAPFSLALERITHREPHPGGQEAYLVRVQLPWQRSALCNIKIEITFDEPTLLPTPRLPLIHGYGDGLAASVLVYSLEEIVAEKLRGLLQSEARRAERGWTRPRARDFYDLWRILGGRDSTVDSAAIRRILPAKCAVRHVSWSSADDFFAPGLVAEVERAWRPSLQPLVAALPGIDEVLAALRPAIGGLLHPPATR